MNKIDCIYILNLKKERERLKQCLMLLADEEIYIPIKIFPGIHWRSEQFKNEVYEKVVTYSKKWQENDGNPMKYGQIAGSYSHIRILQDALKNNYQSILMLEDDVYCNKIGDLQKEINKYHRLIRVHNDFDLYYIGREKIHQKEEQNYKDTEYIIPGYSWNAHAVIFSKQCIQKLLNTSILQNLIPFDEFLPLCYGDSNCKNLKYFQSLFPKIINAVSSNDYKKVYQCLYESSRYKHLIKEYTTTDIDNSDYVNKQTIY